MGEKVLLLGKAGGREYSIAKHILERNSKDEVEELHVAPGSDGLEELGKKDYRLKRHNVTSYSDWETLAKEKDISLAFVGPEQPLLDGILDNYDIPIVGPNRLAAELEGSKLFGKGIMDYLDIPTASWNGFDLPSDAYAYLDTLPYPVVVKADGPAFGKGVDVCGYNRQLARDSIRKHLVEKAFGRSSDRII